VLADRRWNWRLESRLYPQTGMSALRTVFCSLLSRSADCDPCPLASAFSPQPYLRCHRDILNDGRCHGDISPGPGNCYIGGDADNTDSECRRVARATRRAVSRCGHGCAGGRGGSGRAGRRPPCPGRALPEWVWAARANQKKAVKHKETHKNTPQKK
jgi:hypothetical protein